MARCAAPGCDDGRVLLGGPGAETLGRVLWAEFFTNRDWPTASALAIVLLALLLLPAVWWQRREKQP